MSLLYGAFMFSGYVWGFLLVQQFPPTFQKLLNLHENYRTVPKPFIFGGLGGFYLF